MAQITYSYITDIEFEELMAPFFIKDHFAVAVSGGVDSIALGYLANRYAIKNDLQMTALTVDHGLRLESVEEAEWVHSLMAQNNIVHEVLLWKHAGELPQTKIQESARIARYDLLSTWCKANAVQFLLTAHHLDDQVETFFIRLAHRSGLKGLSSMRQTRETPFGSLLRPLLPISKARLVATLQHYNVEWRDDPSNAKDQFERVRFRKALSQMYDQGLLDPSNITESIRKLQNIDDFFDESVRFFLNTYDLQNFPLKAFQQQHPLLQCRILSFIVKKLSLKRYMPPDATFERARQKMMNSNFKGLTLGGLYFRRAAGSTIQVSYEMRKIYDC
ncbi:MAG: tRNA lysidine(34) synthetase TilS [Candidatus Paracaedibacteraceae bacterium]|nr:tRNA lysidine(34) synthetase TilS [Candidatus Paracaedibacteraceae bacterium]